MRWSQDQASRFAPMPRVSTRGAPSPLPARSAGRYTSLLLFLLLWASIGLACAGDSGPPPSDVVSVIPWPNQESLSYVLKNKKGDVLGRCTLSVAVQGSQTVLSQRFESPTSRDSTSVIVNSRTLKPVSSTRDIVTRNDEERLEVTYTDQGALIKQDDKQSGLPVPVHAYDNDTSLFLWRTLAYGPGYEASYITIITNRRSSQKVTLRVTGKESVRVPAGEFQAWRLEIKTRNAKQTAWYADTPTRPLLRYDNDRDVIFELERLP